MGAFRLAGQWRLGENVRNRLLSCQQLKDKQYGSAHYHWYLNNQLAISRFPQRIPSQFFQKDLYTLSVNFSVFSGVDRVGFILKKLGIDLNKIALQGARLHLILIVFVLFLVALPYPASATVIGANKGVIDLKNVMKNGYAQELVTLTTDTDFNLSINYKVEGDVADWIRFEPQANPFYISKNNPYTIAIIVEPPQDARVDKYTGSVRFITGALAGPEGQFGTAVRTAININMAVQVTGQEVVSCTVPEVTLNDVEEGYPLEFYAVISNGGNVRLKPSFILEFWNQDQTKLVETMNFTTDDEILPTTQRRIFKSLPQSLPIGQYWVRMKTPVCGEAGAGFYTMSIVERGGVSDKGVLLTIQNPVDARVGQIVPIDAVFQNLGSRVVSAKFKGTITSGGKDNIFKLIDTEPIDVAPGKTESLRTYFNPTQEGQYMISGQVLYNKKLTFEKLSILNVYPLKVGLAQGIFSTGTIVLVLLAIIIAVLIILIMRNKRNHAS
jgi:hypothetical protein